MVEVVERSTVLIGIRRGREDAMAAALAEMRLTLPEMGRFVEDGDMLLARVSPFQVLAMASVSTVAPLRFLAALSGCTAMIDLSDARIGLNVSGAGATARMAQLAPIDLDLTHFGPGRCVQTMVAHVGALVLRLGHDHFELQVSRSFFDGTARAVDATLG